MGVLDNIASSITGSTEKAILQIVIPQDGTEPKYYPKLNYGVQYNPSSLSISSMSGAFQQRSFGGEGVSRFCQYNVPPTSSLSVELIFDDMIPDDSFMFAKFMNLSPLKAVQDIASAQTKFFSKYGHTVQPQVEGFLSLVSDDSINKVVFNWSSMTFAGVLTSVDASYTMFNPLGHPVRASICLTIQQNEYDSKVFDAALMKSFDTVFGVTSNETDTEFNAADSASFLQNFINL